MKTIPLLLVLLVCFAGGSLRAGPESPAPPPKAPFRLVFKGYDGDSKTGKPESFAFQVDTIDQRRPSEFLKLGDFIPKTHLKLLKFEFKEAFDAKLHEKVDVSELTVLNTVTKKTAVLPPNKIVDVSATNTPGP